MTSDVVSSELPPRNEQDGEVVVDAIVEASAFQDFIAAVDAVADEAKLHFNDGGIHTAVVDPAQVAMAYVDLGTDAFESYDAGAVTVGVDLSRLADQFGLANAGDLVRMRVDMDVMSIRLSISDTIHPTIKTIDPDSIRKEPDLPDLDLPNTAHLSPGRLNDAIDAVKLLYGSSTVGRTKMIQLGWDEDAEQLVFAGQSDTDETRVEYAHDDLGGGSHFDDATASLFNLDYVTELADPIPDGTDAEDVTIRFGEDFPMIWEWTGQDGALEVESLCAPRIASN